MKLFIFVCYSINLPFPSPSLYEMEKYTKLVANGTEDDEMRLLPAPEKKRRGQFRFERESIDFY